METINSSPTFDSAWMRSAKYYPFWTRVEMCCLCCEYKDEYKNDQIESHFN
jgi:hypothetical protein